MYELFWSQQLAGLLFVDEHLWILCHIFAKSLTFLMQKLK